MKRLFESTFPATERTHPIVAGVYRHPHTTEMILVGATRPLLRDAGVRQVDGA